jgi:hypothetical protein
MAAPKAPRVRKPKPGRRPKKISRYILRPVRSLSLRRRVVDAIAAAEVHTGRGKKEPGRPVLAWMSRPLLELSDRERTILAAAKAKQGRAR